MWTQWFASGIFAISALVGISACVVAVDEPLIDEEIAQPLSETNSPDGFTHPRLRWRRPIHLVHLDRRFLRCLPDPYKTYLTRDTEMCSRIRFYCPDGGVPFFDSCGCGCDVRPEPTLE